MEAMDLMLSKPSNSSNSNSSKCCRCRRPNLVHRTLARLEMSQVASISLLAPPSLDKMLLPLRLCTSNSIIWTMVILSSPIRTLYHLFRNNSSHRWRLIKWAGNNNNNSSSSSSNNLLLLVVPILLLLMVVLLKVISPKTIHKLLNQAHLILAWWMMRL